MRQNRPRVKRTRVSAPSDAPFGFGLLASAPYYGRQPFTASDAAWAAQNLGSDDLTDAEWDALAYDRMLEDAYLASVGADNRCLTCGWPSSEPLRGGECPTCVMDTLGAEHEWAADLAPGACGICGRQVDYLEASGACLPCELEAERLAACVG